MVVPSSLAVGAEMNCPGCRVFRLVFGSRGCAVGVGVG